MIKSLLPILAVLLFACRAGFHQPTDEEVKSAATKMFDKRNGADGGGGWHIERVDIIRVSKGSDERHYNATVRVRGVHTAPPLAIKQPDEPVDEQTEVALRWSDGGWIWDDTDN